MLINEVIRQVDLTRRAVKFYEEKGLIKPSKDSNGYRNYTEEDIQRLKEISVYRKLGSASPISNEFWKGKKKNSWKISMKVKKRLFRQRRKNWMH